MAFSNAPLSVQELTDLALKYEYNPYIPLKSWLRSANFMQKEVCCLRPPRSPIQSNALAHTTQAQIYAAEGNDQQTYVLLSRHANLHNDRLQKHPQKSDPENRRALSDATAGVTHDIQKMEEIRPRLKKRHEEWLAKKKKAQQKALHSIEGKSVRLVPQEMEGHRPHEKQLLDAVGNQSLAAKLAQREVMRRDAARRGVRQAGVSEEEESERRTGGVWGDWETDLRKGGDEDHDLSAQLQEVARLQGNGHRAVDYSVRRQLCVWICMQND